MLWVAEESIFPFCQVHTVGEPPAWTVMLRAVLVMSTLVTGPLSEAATSSSMIARVWMPSRGDVDGVTFEEGTRAVRLGSSEGAVGDDEWHDAHRHSVTALAITLATRRNPFPRNVTG